LNGEYNGSAYRVRSAVKRRATLQDDADDEAEDVYNEYDDDL